MMLDCPGVHVRPEPEPHDYRGYGGGSPCADCGYAMARPFHIRVQFHGDEVVYDKAEVLSVSSYPSLMKTFRELREELEKSKSG